MGPPSRLYPMRRLSSHQRSGPVGITNRATLIDHLQELFRHLRVCAVAPTHRATRTVRNDGDAPTSTLSCPVASAKAEEPCGSNVARGHLGTFVVTWQPFRSPVGPIWLAIVDLRPREPDSRPGRTAMLL